MHVKILQKKILYFQLALHIAAFGDKQLKLEITYNGKLIGKGIVLTLRNLV